MTVQSSGTRKQKQSDSVGLCYPKCYCTLYIVLYLTSISSFISSFIYLTERRLFV